MSFPPNATAFPTGDDIHPTAVGNALIANVIILWSRRSFGDDTTFYTEDELADLARIP